jgi:hypothetical protein
MRPAGPTVAVSALWMKNRRQAKPLTQRGAADRGEYCEVARKKLGSVNLRGRPVCAFQTKPTRITHPRSVFF